MSRLRRRTLPIFAGVILVVMGTSACVSPLLGDAAGEVRSVDGVSAPADCGQPDGSPFRVTDPAAVGLNSGRLAAAVKYSTARGAQSVRIYRHGCLVAKSGHDNYAERMRLPSWSMTKGMVSVAMGRAVELGLVNVDDQIGGYLPDLPADKASLTVRQFLNQITGLRFAWANDLHVAGSEDSVTRTLQRPFSAEPGTEFVYAQTTVTVLVAVLEAAAGEDFQSFAHREIFQPLGITRDLWRWARDGSGRTQGFALLDMAPVAWARIGQLLLDNGMWNGTQLVNADYISQGSRGTEVAPDYGFLWWTNTGPHGDPIPPPKGQTERRWPYPDDTFSLTGLFDQRVTVIPSLDMVVVRMGPPTEMFGDPIGESPGIRPKWEYRFSRILMQSVEDVHVLDPGPFVYHKEDLLISADNFIDFGMYPFG